MGCLFDIYRGPFLRNGPSTSMSEDAGPIHIVDTLHWKSSRGRQDRTMCAWR